MFQRDLESELIHQMAQYPVVSLMGPRQSGKTTLVKSVYPKRDYYNLEEPDTLARIVGDPRGFFNQHPEGMILDEIQRAPELISYIQSIVDDTQKPGQFILTGSHQLSLHEAITQSLAGRTALLDLLPLTIGELARGKISLTLEEYLLKGFYPGIYYRHLNHIIAYRNYVRTYVERDVRQIINVKDLKTFQEFVRLSAGRIGSILNTESLSNDVGVSHNTVRSWLSVLDASYLTYRLQPYFENFGKRIIKSPKLYFMDVGLGSYLLGLENEGQISRDRLRGSLFENLTIMELIKARYNQSKEPNLYYYRDNHGNEVDVIYQYGHQLIPIEIKSTATFNPALLKNLKYFKGVAKDRMPTGFVIYSGDKEYEIQGFHIINYKNTARIFELIDSDRVN